MDKKNSTPLIVTIVVFATLIIVILLAAMKSISSNMDALRSSQAETVQEEVEQIETKEPEEIPVEAEIAENPTTMYVANVQNSIYLRSVPEENENNIITTIPVGDQVVWLENTDNVFSKVSYAGKTGYVKRDYLSAIKPQQNAPSGGNTSIYKYMYVDNVKNSIYLRSSAKETSDNIITTIPVGTEVGFIEYANNVFSKINYNGTIGYVKSAYLSDYYNYDYDANYTYLTVCNVKHSIYLRSSPVENSNNIICEIPLGDTVRYLGNPGGGFYKISYNGYTGYSKSKFLR